MPDSVPNSKRSCYTVRYFAVLREEAGCSQEIVESAAGTPAELYRELSERHSLKWRPELLRAVINESYAEMDAPLKDGDRVVYIPPVAGG